MLDLDLAIAHHLLVFTLFGVLFAELVAVRRGLDQAGVARIAAVDLWYGILAGLILIVGFARANFAAKGWAYYSHNAFFWGRSARSC
jgi:putative membrane protein